MGRWGQLLLLAVLAGWLAFWFLSDGTKKESGLDRGSPAGPAVLTEEAPGELGAEGTARVTPGPESDEPSREPTLVSKPALSGLVVSTAGAPLAGAEVTWHGWHQKDLDWEPAWQADDWGPLARTIATAVTDAAGDFAFDHEVVGELGTVLWATHREHEAACVLLAAGESPTSSTATIRMGPPAAMRVRVVDGSGNPVAGAEVDHFGVTPSRAPRGADGKTPERARRLLARTYPGDVSGTIRCAAFPGDQVLVAREGGRRSLPWRGRQQDEVLLVLESTFTIAGSVTFPDWSHLGYEGERRLIVRARRGEDTLQLLSLRPLVEGAFGPETLPLLVGAEYELEVAGSPIVPLLETFPAPTPDARLDFELAPELGHSLTFLVEDEAGRPLGDAEAASEWEVAGRTHRLRRRAEPDGYVFAWSMPPDVEVRTLITAPGCGGQWCYPIRVPENPPATHRVILKKEAVLRGRCTHGGRPLSDFEVVAWVPGQSSLSQVARTFRGSPDGRFEMDGVPEGKLQVVASTGKLPHCRPRLVELPSSEILELELEAPIVGSGQVLDLESGAPIEGARIQALAATAEGVLRPWGPVNLSDREGRFAFEGFLTGRNVILVRAEGYAERELQSISKDSGSVDFGRITLDRPQTLELRLVSDKDPTTVSGLTAEGTEGTPLPRRSFDAAGVVRFPEASSGTNFLLLEGSPSPTWTYLRLELERGRVWRFEHRVSGRRRLVVDVIGGGEERATFRGLVIGYVSRQGVQTELGVPFPASGTLSFDGIDAEGARVTVLGATGPLRLVALAELQGEDLHARLELDAEPFVLRVVDPEGAPVPGVVVRLSESAPAPFHVQATTDGDGLCDFRGLPRRTLSASLEHEVLGRAIGIPVDCARGEVELVFSTAGRLDLRIRDGFEPLAGVLAKVQLSPVGPRWSVLGTSDETGAILASDLGEVSYRITTDHPDCWPTTAELLATPSPSPQEIQVRRRGALLLRLQAVDGSPLASAPVDLFSEEFGADVRSWIEAGAVRARTGLVTDSAGEMRVERLPRGPYRLRVRGSDERIREERCEVAAGQLTLVPVVLP